MLRTAKLLILLAVLTSCSSSGTTEGAESEEPDAEVVGATTPNTSAAVEVAVDEGERDREAERRFLDGLDLGGPISEEEAELRLSETREILLLQELYIEDCMNRLGFEYFFDPPEDQVRRDSGFEEDYGSAEWTARYGLGITTLMFSQEVVGDDLVGTPGAPFQPPSVDESNDPETLYLESLGASGQDSYWTALFGYSLAAGDEPTRERFEESCAGQAREAHPDRSRLVYLEWGEDEVGQLVQRIDTEPEMVAAAEDSWQCVENNGYSFASEAEIRAEIGMRLEEELFVLLPAPDFSNPTFVEVFEEIQRFELNVADTLLSCGATLHQLSEIRGQVALRLAYEEGLL